ncbi:MAG: hypothetical protein JJ969_02730 [Rhizobiaceae bacterium]|nr:hypothetical protein [Rhizobiaceae bacterium]
MTTQDAPSARLPYFKSLTDRCRTAVGIRIKAAAKAGVLAEIGNYTIFEGHQTKLRRHDESLDETEIMASSAEILAERMDLENIDRAYVENKINELARQLNESMTKELFETINAVTEKTGNVVESGGPLTNEKMLEIQRMMPALSDPFEDGNLMMVVSPNMMERIQELEKEFQSSPSLKKKYEAMRIEKYEEYRSNRLDRELAG